MDLGLAVAATTLLSGLCIAFVIRRFSPLFRYDENPLLSGRVIRLLEQTQVPEAKKVLTETDIEQISQHCSNFAWQSFIYMIAAVGAVVFNIVMAIAVSNNMDYTTFMSLAFIVTNAWVIANANLSYKIDRFVTSAESRIMSMIITDKAGQLAGKPTSQVTSEDVVAWIEHQNEETERELRELGVDPEELDALDDDELDRRMADLDKYLDEKNDTNQ